MSGPPIELIPLNPLVALDLDALNWNLRILAEQINVLSRGPQPIVLAGLTLSSGSFTGPLEAPGMALVGADGSATDVLHEGSALATPTVLGLVVQGTAVPDCALVLGSAAGQWAAVGNTLNALLASLRAAGILRT